MHESCRWVVVVGLWAQLSFVWVEGSVEKRLPDNKRDDKQPQRGRGGDECVQQQIWICSQWLLGLKKKLLRANQHFLSCSRRAVWLPALQPPHRQLLFFTSTTQWQLQPWTLLQGSFQEVELDFSAQSSLSQLWSVFLMCERNSWNPPLRAEKLKSEQICSSSCSLIHFMSSHSLEQRDFDWFFQGDTWMTVSAAWARPGTQQNRLFSLFASVHVFLYICSWRRVKVHRQLLTSTVTWLVGVNIHGQWGRLCLWLFAMNPKWNPSKQGCWWKTDTEISTSTLFL